LNADMSDDLKVDGAGAAPAGVDARLADPGFGVHADPKEVLGLVDAALRVWRPVRGCGVPDVGVSAP